MLPEDIEIAEKYLVQLDSNKKARKTNKENRAAFIKDRRRIADPADGLADDGSSVGRDSAQSSPQSKSSASLHDSSLHAALDAAFAKMYFCCALTKAVVENPAAADFWCMLKNRVSGWEPPCRWSLLGDLLDREYTHVRTEVNRQLNLKAEYTYVTVSADGWSNPRRQSLINVMVTTDRASFFSHAVDATGKTKDHVFNGALLNNAIASIGGLEGDEARAAVACVVTDNASDMTTAWDLVYAENPHVVCVGCSAHGFSLMYADIMGLTWVDRMVKMVKLVCKKFRNITQLNDLVRELSKRPEEAGGVGMELGLILYGETRMASSIYMIERYLRLLVVLNDIVQRPFISGTCVALCFGTQLAFDFFSCVCM